MLVTNGSMQADAFLFDELVGAGDAVVVEQPTYDRTLLGLRQRGADVHMVELRARRHRRRRAGARCWTSGLRPTLAHIIPNFQNPAGYTLSAAKRERCSQLAARARLPRSSRTTRTSRSASRGERCRRCSRLDARRPRRLRVVVLQDGLPRHPRRLPRRPAELIATNRERATNTYISPNMVAQSIVYQFCRRGAIERSIETVKAALAERVETLAAALSAHLPEARFVAPEGGYFMWVELPEGTDVAALFDAAAARGVAFVKGTDFLLEGGENTLRLAYSGVTADADRRGRQRASPRRYRSRVGAHAQRRIDIRRS